MATEYVLNPTAPPDAAICTHDKATSGTRHLHMFFTAIEAIGVDDNSTRGASRHCAVSCRQLNIEPHPTNPAAAAMARGHQLRSLQSLQCGSVRDVAPGHVAAAG